MSRIGAAAATALLAACLLLGIGRAYAVEPATFDAPGKAADALRAALEADGDSAMMRLFGDSHPEIYAGDPATMAAERTQVLTAMQELVRVEPDGEDRAVLVMGPAAWPFPIPLVKASGGWRFDVAAGAEEIQDRRIGRNELAAIQVCYDLAPAQAAYAAEDHDDDGVLEYAQRLLSSPGRKDGLYWPASPGEAVSPFGEAVAAAAPFLEGRRQGDPYLGYYYRVLTRQGPNAKGGAHDFLVNGDMIAGFALVAWPAEYGESGITTIMCSNQGDVLETDLGPDTGELGPLIDSYDPDPTWTPVEP